MNGSRWRSGTTGVLVGRDKLYYSLRVRFEWDPVKAASNERKHAVSFEEAVEAVLDPLSIRDEDRAHGDRRERVLGRSTRGRTLFVVILELRGDTIRVISARKATTAERRAYEEG